MIGKQPSHIKAQPAILSPLCLAASRAAGRAGADMRHTQAAPKVLSRYLLWLFLRQASAAARHAGRLPEG